MKNTKKLHGRDIGQEMPEEFLTSHLIWDQYISKIWLSILHFCELKNTDVIVEIGPGVSTKIGGALNSIDFKGKLYVIDALPDVIKVLKPKYQKLLPNAEIVFLDKSLENAIDDITEQGVHILGNHILDDMLIYAASHENALDWSAEYTHKPSEKLQKAWQSIFVDKELLKKAQSLVFDDIKLITSRLNPSSVVLNQYPSATLNDHDMMSLNNSAITVLEMLKQEFKQEEVQNILNTHPHYNNDHIGNHVLNSEYWMICKN